MKTIWITLTTLLIGAALQAQEIKVYESFDNYQFHLEKNNDTTYVINYWATYCAPCVKEMPVFNRLSRAYQDRPVKILLTSLDFASNMRQRVQKFIQKHEVRPEVVILDDPRSNAWINQVSPEWSGALPATLIYNRKSRSFYEKTFTYPELKNIIESKISEL